MARQLAANVYVGDTLYPAGSTPPKDIAEQITNPKAWGDTDTPAAESDEDGPQSYGSLSKADLVAEIEKRNDGREDDATLPTSGNKADLVAALEADDASA